MALIRFAQLGFITALFGLSFMVGTSACSSDDDDDATGGTGGVLGAGGAPPAAGGATVTACGADLLSDAAALGTDLNWVGGDPTLTDDNVCGIQGAIYVYGDYEVTPANSGCTPVKDTPPCVPSGAGVKCCVKGITVVDTEYKAWGCGLGLSLNDSGGTPSVKSPYSGGTAKGFSYTLEGTTSGQALRVGFSQMADTTGICGPFKGGADGWTGSPVKLDATGKYTGTVTFDEVGCPSDQTCGCTTGSVPYDFQVQVTGADIAGPFEICLTSLTPIL